MSSFSGDITLNKNSMKNGQTKKSNKAAFNTLGLVKN